MTEDDTFKRLRGLSIAECQEMYTRHCLPFLLRNPDNTLDDVRARIDEILKPYGWTCEKMQNCL